MPERALLTTNSSIYTGGRILLCASICGTQAVEVKGKMLEAMNSSGEARSADEQTSEK
ncbi:MAG: hypothetical protein ABR874_20130 [Candidatus Sulfotelmatobacter sp.]